MEEVKSRRHTMTDEEVEAGITWEMLDEQEGLLKEPDYPA